MQGLFGKIVGACVAMVVAISVLLSPANAVAMIDCDMHQTPHTRTVDDHAGHKHSGTLHSKADSTDHTAGHCAAHACVFAIGAVSVETVVSLAYLNANFGAQGVSLVPLASPEGVRRPPRA